MLTFKEINGHNRKVYSLYRRSFPIVERAPVHFLQTRANKGKGKFLGIYDGKKFVGMTYLVIYGDIVFIFYLAINEKHRGGGYGTRILSELKEKYRDYRIILNIEELDEAAPNYEERVRRLHFYEKNGYRLFGYTVCEIGYNYEMLGCGEFVSRKEYHELIKSFLGPVAFKIIYFKAGEE